ncbi:MAG: hypothetical protein FJZ59_00100 [Chlamydiae bacterium]|nr:hypothetical protein [Chlamydiota bacterium]
MQIKFPTQENYEPFDLKAFLFKYKDKILMGSAFFLMGLTFFIKLVTGNERALNEFHHSNLLQERCRLGQEVDLKEISSLIKTHKELAPLFSSYLEEAHALKGDTKKAKQLSDASLKRLSFLDPCYKEFARTSLFIQEGKYDEALARSLLMKKEMNKDKFPNLFALNLVRIAFLETLLKSPSSSAKWEEAKEAASNEVYLHFTEDDLTLFDLYL